jgi:hypothetical protein
VTFGRGWFSVSATHWFEASDATLFPSRDGQRLLAQAACGGICEVTIAWAPRLGDECRKCLRTLCKVMSQKPGKRADSSGPTGASPGEFRRLYRGVTKPYDPDRVRRDRASGTDFTDCLIWGGFDEFIVTQLAAKDLRAQVRQKGIITASDEQKAYLLRRYVEDRRRKMVLH